MVHKNVTILLRLVNQILDFRKYENGKLELVLSNIDLRAQLQEWSGAFRALALKKHIHFILDVGILKSKAANEVAAEQMDVWKVLGEKFNMDFEFDNPPQDNYNERLNLVMMDAQLPDIIMDMPTTEVLKYGESGVILSLNDYIENNMPNLKKEIDKRDGVEKALTYSDGNIYYMPMLDEKVSGNMPLHRPHRLAGKAGH